MLQESAWCSGVLCFLCLEVICPIAPPAFLSVSSHTPDFGAGQVRAETFFSLLPCNVLCRCCASACTYVLLSEALLPLGSVHGVFGLGVEFSAISQGVWSLLWDEWHFACRLFRERTCVAA